MNYYILRDVTTKEELLRSTRDDGFIPESVDIPNSEVVLITFDTIPSPDPATEKVVETISEFGSNPIIQAHSYSIVPLSQTELDAIAAEEDRQSKRQTLSTVITTYETWVTQLENYTVISGNISGGNVVNTLQQLVNHQQQMYRDFSYLLKWLRINL